MLDYEKKLIAHVTCPPPKVKLGEVTCPKCWLVHAGDCF